MIPIPSEERSVHPKRFRGVPRLYDVTRSEPYLHTDQQRKQSEQERFTSSPYNMVHKGLSHEPPRLEDERRRLRHVTPPQPHEHPEGKRNPHRVPPIPDTLQRAIFPSGGLVERPEVTRAASCMETYSKDAHFILGHISQCDEILESKPGRRIFPKAHERSTRGDMSLAVSGVKRVPLPVRNAEEQFVAGFRGMGQQTDPSQLKTGTRHVAPFTNSWDPLHIFETYGRRHPPIPGL